MVDISKFTNNINITINKSQQEEYFFSDFKNNNGIKNIELIKFAYNDNLPYPITVSPNKVINFSNIFKELYNARIKNKYTKIVRYKKIILIIYKLEEIPADLREWYNLFLLLEKYLCWPIL